MMPVIRIPDPVFERLQAIATPLVDSPASVIEKLLDFYESHERVSRRVSSVTSAQAEPSPKVASFSAEAPPDLRFTRILSAKFDGQTASNWNDLVHVAHRQAFARLGSLDALRSATQSNIANGRRSDQGFCYHSDIGVSIQGVAADIAWQNTLNLAERLQVPVQVEFEWRQNEHAAHPGKRASISWAPPQSENEGKLQEIGRESKSLLKNVDSDVKEETKVPSREGRAVKRIMQDERMMSYLRSLPTYAGKSDEEILKELRKGWHAQ